MGRYYNRGEYGSKGAQIVDIGGGGYKQTGNIEVKQEQAIHVHVHIHIEQGAQEGLAELPELSWIGRLVGRLTTKRTDVVEPERELTLPPESFTKIFQVATKELDNVQETVQETKAFY